MAKRQRVELRTVWHTDASLGDKAVLLSRFSENSAGSQLKNALMVYRTDVFFSASPDPDDDAKWVRSDLSVGEYLETHVNDQEHPLYVHKLRPSVPKRVPAHLTLWEKLQCSDYLLLRVFVPRGASRDCVRETLYSTDGIAEHHASILNAVHGGATVYGAKKIGEAIDDAFPLYGKRATGLQIVHADGSVACANTLVVDVIVP